MLKGVKYHSYSNTSGYGLTALAYVRALVNAGIPVWWQPTFYSPIGVLSWTPLCAPQLLDVLRLLAEDEAWSDLPALLAATTRPVECDVQLVHMVPEYWPMLLEPGKRQVGYTMWEADRLPEHWPQWLNLADRLLVPNESCRTMFGACGVQRPVHAIPHIRRHVWNRFTAEEQAQARARWRVPAHHYVFYSIGNWDPRKHWPALITAFLEEFRSDEPVTLLLKTSSQGINPDSQQRSPVQALVQEIASAYLQRSGRSSVPAISLIPVDDMPGRDIDMLHALGNCYVSLSHGECWGMGAFDAATLGRPVLMTGWGGQTDFLGSDYPGLLHWQLAPVQSWPGYESYAAPQQWAVCDLDHARKQMRWAFEQRQQAQAMAESRRAHILNRYAEPVIARRLIEALS